MIVIVYWILGYLAYGYVNSNKTYIYQGYGKLFAHKAIMGLILGWFYIPWAVLKMIFGRN